MAVNVAAMRKGLVKQVYGECAVSLPLKTFSPEFDVDYCVLHVKSLSLDIIVEIFFFSLVPMKLCVKPPLRETLAKGQRPPLHSWTQSLHSGCAYSVEIK